MIAEQNQYRQNDFKQDLQSAAEAGREAFRVAVHKNRLAMGLIAAIVAGIVEIAWEFAEHKSREAIAARVVILFIVVPIWVIAFHKLRSE
jgi:hypothetical protein